MTACVIFNSMSFVINSTEQSTNKKRVKYFVNIGTDLDPAFSPIWSFQVGSGQISPKDGLMLQILDLFIVAHLTVESGKV